MQKTIVRNIDTLLLAHQIIPPKDFIPLYDTSPYKILNGHLTAKIPCDTNYTSSLQILVGHLPDLKPVQLRLVKEFSTRGNICLYHVDLGSTTTMSSSTTAIQNNNSRATGGLQANKTNTTTAINTDLVLSNPTSDMVVLPNTSTVVIGINEIMPIDSTTAPPKITPASSINDNNTSPNQSQERSGQISSMINSMACWYEQARYKIAKYHFYLLSSKSVQIIENQKVYRTLYVSYNNDLTKFELFNSRNTLKFILL